MFYFDWNINLITHYCIKNSLIEMDITRKIIFNRTNNLNQKILK